MPIKILMPALSPTMEEGTLAAWQVKEGDTVEPGDILAEIETDKATMEVEAVDEGVIGKILITAGTENVAVNTPIALLLEDGEDKAALDGVSLDAPKAEEADKTAVPEKEARPEAKPSPAPAAVAPASPVASGGGRIIASPLAKRIAKDKGIDLAGVTGSGPRGRIVKADLDGAQPGTVQPSAQASQQQASGSALSAGPDARKLADAYGMSYEAVPADNVRKTIARRLQEAKQTVPHFYLTIDCNIDALLAARKNFNADLEAKGVKLSVNDFVIKAVAHALKEIPAANASWAGDSILMYQHADISVAVATENGLITPIVKAAETKGLADISSEIKDLAGRARDGKLKPEEFQGGTFSVSNLGMYGIREFSAIINPPQGCILAVGMGEKRPVVNDQGVLTTATMMTCTLSCDHRVVDGAVGAEFLAAFKRNIEDPLRMIV